MWKTPSRFWAQISPFTHNLPSETAEIHCTAVDLPLFRKPHLEGVQSTSTTSRRRLCRVPDEPLRSTPRGLTVLEGAMQAAEEVLVMRQLMDRYLRPRASLPAEAARREAHHPTYICLCL